MQNIIQKSKFSRAGVFLIVGLILALAGTVWAGASHSASGFAWGGTEDSTGAYDGMGWISFNCTDTGSCGTSDYGVNIPASDGPLSGYAWSGGTTGEPDGGYGWISFEDTDLAGCSPALAQASRSGNTIIGGARILSIRDAGGNAGGFDGCISLSGVAADSSPYGVTINPGGSTLDGYAWSSDLGWISFDDVVFLSAPVVSLSVNPITTYVDGDTIDLTWVTNTGGTITDCTATGDWSGLKNIAGDTESITVSGSGTYTYNIECTGPGGSSGVVPRTITVIDKPNIVPSAGAVTPSVSFDPATGEYDSVTIGYNVTNDASTAGSDTGPFTNTVTMDIGNDGSIETTVVENVANLVAPGGSTPVNSVTLGNNVPFGDYEVVITADSDTPDDVDESNELDNVITLTDMLPPPDPGIEIDADRQFVSNGETVTISWDTKATYLTNCSVRGPGMTTVNFNPSVDGVSDFVSGVGPITAKSVYTLSCTEAGVTFTDTVDVESTGQFEEI